MSGGWNPLTGRDPTGARPNFAPYGAPIPGQNQAYVPHAGGPAYHYGIPPPYGPWANMTYGAYHLGGQYSPFIQPGLPTNPYYAQQQQYPYSYQPNGAGAHVPRQPHAYPTIDPTMPAAQMTNSTGGIGCEPGYNYFFPANHTKVHIFRSHIPPWHLPASAQIQFRAVHLPCNITVAEMMKGFGCTNPSPKKNRCYELNTSGGGKWYRGLTIFGSDKDMMKKTVGELGWDETRTGGPLPTDKPVVCLWFCKD